MNSHYETLKIIVQDGVARLDLNRPDKSNSLDRAMWKELGAAFDALDANPAVRVVVLGGAGKHFSTGIDLGLLIQIQQELHDLPDGSKQEMLKHQIVMLQDSVNAIENCRKPVIAAIDGLCLGAGVDIVTACDIRYATTSARFAVKEVDLAIVADVGSLQRLPNIVGEGIARELAFTGRLFKGNEALSMGLVNQVFPDNDDLEASVSALAAELTRKSPLTLRGIKETMNYSRDHSVAEGLNYVALRNAAMLLSNDLVEAVTAFYEKRPPSYEQK